MIRLIFSLALAVAALAPAGAAQVIRMEGSRVVVLDGGGVPQEAPAPPGGAAPGKPAAQPPGPRQTKLQQAEYDRRPSAILKAWSEPPKPKEAAKPAEMPGAGTGAEAATPPTAPPVAATAVPPSPAAVAVGAPSTPPAPAPAGPPQILVPPLLALPPEPPLAILADAPAAAAPAADAAAAKEAAAKEAAAKKAAEAAAIDEEIATLQRNVTLGAWPEVKDYFAKLSKDEAKAGYEKLLQSLQTGPKPKPNAPQPQIPPQVAPYQEKNRYDAGDVVGLCAAAPFELEKSHAATIGQILRQALDAGMQLDVFIEGLKPRLGTEGFPLDARKLARLLAAANELIAMGDFLPGAEEAQAKNDREGFNLLSRHWLARFDQDKKTEWLEKAWTITLAALAAGEVAEEEKSEALKRAVDIAPRIRKDLGAAWLDESFSARPERGMEILASIGTSSSLGIQSSPMSSAGRQKWLELQSTAVKALLRAAPERAEGWRQTLEILAVNWLREAGFTYKFDASNALGPRMQRDMYGNFYYFNEFGGDPQQRGPLQAIRTGEILDLRPDDTWLGHVDAALRPQFDMVFAQLYLKVGEDERAFPYIEKLAGTHPKPAKGLVDEFLQVWSKNHDPNSDRNRANPYVYFYGFEERANAIPLTRSKQERNLAELGALVARLRKLPVELDEKLLAQAFTRAHSVAEVYRLEVVEQVFGPVRTIAPGTLAELVQGMRGKLATVWRDPAVQDKSKTKRRPQDIAAEVLRGYALAHATLDQALQDHPASWALALADASILHDENNYFFELRKDPSYSGKRGAAFERFAEAARLYAADESIDQEKESTSVYETWFYAALGACDLGALSTEQQLAAKEIPKIRAAIDALPEKKAERHLAMIASSLFTRLSSVKPAFKFRYVREGLALVGEHPRAREARAVFDYYGDLVTEIQLVARIDGSDRVGHDAPFGLHVDLRHTREIERESGGFGKYLQNQNSQSFAYNYGRPLEDYRDKFEDAARGALSDRFEVMSVTFSTPEVKSRADDVYGWRVTPYAYVLLKARGPEVDRIPSLRLDLDFLDTSGYAVIPVESPIVPVDAAACDDRPFEDLEITQTLDERQGKDGKLKLEIKATARGVVPALGEMLDLCPAGFVVEKESDAPPSIVKLDEASGATKAVSERHWTVTLRAKDEQAAMPATFAFAGAKVPVKSTDHFRYVDADLVSVGAVVDLERKYGTTSLAWLWWAGGLVVAAAVAAVFAIRRARRPRHLASARFPVPETINAFTVLGLLRDIDRNDGLTPAARSELDSQISRIESFYFAEPAGDAPDLARIATDWSSRAR